MVAMNYQRFDEVLWVYQGFFRSNYSFGFVERSRYVCYRITNRIPMVYVSMYIAVQVQIVFMLLFYKLIF